ncbi:MAG: hypothetical protein M1484_01730 [Patescibacteria group bacterium]|nr:hypothetical protein [Patescibacteria group bacterium]
MFRISTRIDKDGQRVGRPTHKRVDRLNYDSLLSYESDLYRQLHTEGGDITANRRDALMACIEKVQKERERRGL